MNGINLLKCICDETRFEILEKLLESQELCVSDFVDSMKKDQPLISHHLKTLKKCGIVKSREEGKKMMYSITSDKISKLILNITKTSKEIPGLLLCDDGNKQGHCC